MNKCKYCGQEIKDKPKWVKLNSKVEVETAIHDFGIVFNDIIIPKGCRLLTYNELIELANNENLKKMIFPEYNGIYIEQFYEQNKGKYCATAWLGCNVSDFYLYAYNFLYLNFAARGVLFCRNIRRKK